MGSTRRQFTEEYKAQAVAFVIEDHRPVVEVARNIGVDEMTIREMGEEGEGVRGRADICGCGVG